MQGSITRENVPVNGSWHAGLLHSLAPESGHPSNRHAPPETASATEDSQRERERETERDRERDRETERETERQRDRETERERERDRETERRKRLSHDTFRGIHKELSSGPVGFGDIDFWCRKTANLWCSEILIAGAGIVRISLMFKNRGVPQSKLRCGVELRHWS